MGLRLMVPILMATACQELPDEDAKADGDGGGSTVVVEGCLAEPMTLTPGIGMEEFALLSAGDPVTMVPGGQGAWHLEIAGEVRHARQDVSILTVVTALDAPTPIVIAGAGGAYDTEFFALAAYDDALCSGTFWDRRAVVDDFTPPVGQSNQDVICSLEGQRVEITITLAELVEPDELPPPRTVLSTIEATAALHPEDVPLCH